MPSGVLIVTSISVTATALTTFGSINATPAPTRTPNCRRVTNPPCFELQSIVFKMILIAHICS